MHYRQNWQGILSICRKAGKLAMGLEPAKDAMYRGTVSGVLVASDASAKTRKEAAFYCGQAQVPCLELAFTKADFAQMIGRGSGVLAICDDGFFRKMQLLAEQEKQEPRGEAYQTFIITCGAADSCGSPVLWRYIRRSGVPRRRNSLRRTFLGEKEDFRL